MELLLKIAGALIVLLGGWLGVEMTRRKSAEAAAQNAKTKVEDVKLETSLNNVLDNMAKEKAKLAEAPKEKTPEEIQDFWNKK